MLTFLNNKQQTVLNWDFFFLHNWEESYLFLEKSVTWAEFECDVLGRAQCMVCG